MQQRRWLLLASGILFLVLNGCGRGERTGVEMLRSAPEQPVAQKPAPPQRLYQGAIPSSGAAELTVLANMS